MNRFALRVLCLLSICCFSITGEPFRIEVVDKENGWPVPMVSLRTTHNVTFVTDNAGVVAFDLPELMGREVWFAVESHGYERARDGFGNRGVRLKPVAGGAVKIEVDRTIIAKRLGRLTGAGLFAESQKLGGYVDWKESGVLGCDSVQTALHQGRRFWFWGDTTLAHYPLGVFHTTGARTDPARRIAFKPPVQPRFQMFREANQRPRGVAKMPGKGPTWLSAVVSLPDADGAARLVASFVKVEGFVDVYQTGLCVWDDEDSAFKPERVLWARGSEKRPPMPDGHGVVWRGELEGAQDDWILFGNPLPTLRCPATFEAWKDPVTWEVLEPQKTIPRAGGGKAVVPQSGAIAWNEHRQRWVAIFAQKFGEPSFLGEVWYAEAPAPTGPWGPAVKVLSHQNYSFYNPIIHPDSAGKTLLFEGTFTTLFADKPAPLPRYDYNQVLYRLDLDDPALKPALEE